MSDKNLILFFDCPPVIFDVVKKCKHIYSCVLHRHENVLVLVEYNPNVDIINLIVKNNHIPCMLTYDAKYEQYIIIINNAVFEVFLDKKNNITLINVENKDESKVFKFPLLKADIFGIYYFCSQLSEEEIKNTCYSLT